NEKLLACEPWSRLRPESRGAARCARGGFRRITGVAFVRSGGPLGIKLSPAPLQGPVKPWLRSDSRRFRIPCPAPLRVLGSSRRDAGLVAGSDSVSRST